MLHYFLIEEVIIQCLKNVDYAILDLQLKEMSKPYAASYVIYQIEEFLKISNSKSIETIPFILQDDEPLLDSHESHLVMHLLTFNQPMQKSSSFKSKDTQNNKKKQTTFIKNSLCYYYDTQEIYDKQEYKIQKVSIDEVSYDQETDERRAHHFEKISTRHRQDSLELEKQQREKIQREQIQRAVLKGVPYTFDFDGTLIEKKKSIPSIDHYPFQVNQNNILLYQKELSKGMQNQEVIENKLNEIDKRKSKDKKTLGRLSMSIDSAENGEGILIQNKKNINKGKLNEQSSIDKNLIYNNNGSRQTSFIPFIKISDSVIYKERQGSKYKEVRPIQEKKKLLTYKQYQEMVNQSIDQSLQFSVQASEELSIKPKTQNLIPVVLEGLKATQQVESMISRTLPLVNIPRSNHKINQKEENYIPEFNSTGNKEILTKRIQGNKRYKQHQLLSQF